MPRALLGSNGLETNSGILVLEVTVVNGKLHLKFDHGKGAKFLPYLTGLILEPVDRPSIFGLRDKANTAYLSLDRRLFLEGLMSDSISRLLGEIATAGGDDPDLDILDLPDPVFESEVPASPA